MISVLGMRPTSLWNTEIIIVVTSKLSLRINRVRLHKSGRLIFFIQMIWESIFKFKLLGPIPDNKRELRDSVGKCLTSVPKH